MISRRWISAQQLGPPLHWMCVCSSTSIMPTVNLGEIGSKHKSLHNYQTNSSIQRVNPHLLGITQWTTSIENTKDHYLWAIAQCINKCSTVSQLHYHMQTNIITSPNKIVLLKSSLMRVSTKKHDIFWSLITPNTIPRKHFCTDRFFYD